MKNKFAKTFALVFLAAAVATLALPILSACDKKTDGSNNFYIYNWEDYIDTDLLDEFADYYYEKTHTRLNITYTTFDTNETMMTKVLEGDANVDLICPSEYAIEKLLLAGKLRSHLDIYNEISSQLAEYDVQLDGMSSINRGDGTVDNEVMKVIRSMFSQIKIGDDTVDMTNYMVPYMWGTLGILYNTSVVSQEELDEYGWGVLWNVQQNEKLENKILMKDSVRDTYAAAVFYMCEYGLLPDGYQDMTAQELINCTDQPMIDAAEKVLTQQRDHISGYEVDFGKDDMINEIVYADFAWSGDALWAVEEGGYDEETDQYQLGYYVPQGKNETTGGLRYSNIWYDGWVIPTSVRNPLAAMMFIDFMCRPENAVYNSLAIGYTCAADKDLMYANDDVREAVIDCYFEDDISYTDEEREAAMLETVEEYFANEGRYPQINEYLGVMRDFGGRNEAVVNMWQRAKSGGFETSLFIVLAVIIGIVGVAIAAYFIAQALKYRPRKTAPAPQPDDQSPVEDIQ